ncbi:MAG TPA: YciI family protein [Actinomycetota bacterium]|nr:YciI family protein [Actinomycetota bacterium]
MTRYLLLIHDDESVWESLGEADRQARTAVYGQLYEDMAAAGHAVDGDGLANSATATVVRHDGDAIVRTDGPFAETKEQLAGYYIVDCDLEDAVAYAARIPASAEGGVEVRAVGSG